MNTDELIAELRAAFLPELQDHLRELNARLVSLERETSKEARAEHLRALFRAAHTLKGAAQSVGSAEIEQCAAQLEEQLSDQRDGSSPVPGPEELRRIFGLVDELAKAGALLLEPGAAAGAGPGTGPKTAVRVQSELLDRLLARSGELMLARLALDARKGQLDGLLLEMGELERSGALQVGGLHHALVGFGDGFARDLRALGQLGASIENEIRQLRMVPFSEAVPGLTRVALDAAEALGKSVELTVSGAQVELDRAVVEALKDPLLHLVRNAIDHGLESPAEREAAGKPVRGRITISAQQRHDQVEIEVSDDGRGIDAAAVRARAVERGLAIPDSEPELLRLVLLPGFTTRSTATALSGRGVGLDVVRTQVVGLHGSIEVTSTKGLGSRFTLAVPLTLLRARALIVRAGGLALALGVAFVERIVRPLASEVRNISGQAMIQLGGEPVPLVLLAEVLGLSAERPPARLHLTAVVLGWGDRRAAFVVDEVLSEQQAVIKPLGSRLRSLANVSGATLLPDGTLALLINVVQLLGQARPSTTAMAAAPKPAEHRKRRILLADDSPTTRMLQQSILESAGYEVRVARDGEEALRLLNESGAELLLSDVEMPKLGGIGLAEAVRASARFADLPVVLMTGLATDEDRRRGLKAGASAYLVKSGFDQQDLLETIEQLLGEPQ